MFLTLFIVAIILIGILLWNKIHREDIVLKIPSPSKLPIIRHAHHFSGRSPPEVFKLFQKFFSQCGDVWHLGLPFTNTIMIKDVKIVEHILTSQKLIDKSVPYEFFHKWLGLGLLTSTGNKWHKMRKILTPAFHYQILDQMVEIMDKNENIFIEKLKTLEGQEVDVFPLISLMALDIICESAMGVSINAQKNSESEYVKAVKAMANIIFVRSFNPSKRINSLYKLSSLYKEEKKTLKMLHDFTSSIIRSRRKALEKSETNTEQSNNFGVKQRVAFLDLLLQAKLDGRPLSDQSIQEETDTFMFEGHDTVTSALAFTLLSIAKYPEIQQQVFEESESVLGKDLDRSISIKELNQLQYLELVIKESLRLFPSVPVIGRSTKQDEKLGSYIIPKNSSIGIHSIQMHRDPKNFKNPLKFDPLRFESRSDIENFAYIPFSAGPRNCIGQKFAMLELKSAVSKIVRNFEIMVRNENREPLLYHTVTLHSANGVKLIMKSRK